YKALGGIHPDPKQPGFKNILLKPHFVAGLENASVVFCSPRGKIESTWERKKKDIIYRVTVPANATADFYPPVGYRINKAKLSDGKTISISLQATEQGVYRLVSGQYVFEMKK
ncbi:MAG: alpha-rhamnosidase, partial [Prevotellaceae bacterium]|nr:alpha-rhamnosidase [Prevotellaceae bacterium]